jgi:hypothetical protein
MHRPRIERIHHLTIAVPSLEGALDLWRDALGVSPDIREFPELQMREAAFPVGELEVRRSCGLAGDFVSLATLAGGGPLVARVPDGRGIYFCATLPRSRDSSLASEGIVLSALVQRLVEQGLEPLAGARQIDAGPAASGLLAETRTGPRWEQLVGPRDAVSTETGLQAGVYASSGRLVAVNRPAAEDTAGIAANDRIDALFRGLSFTRITGTAGRTDSLVQEIWRAFLIAMLLALIAEGLLCLPQPRSVRTAATVPRALEAA